MSHSKPQVISIHHDGQEVLRNKQGAWVEIPTATPPSSTLPTCIKFFFDGELVYHLEGGTVHNDTLKTLLQN